MWLELFLAYGAFADAVLRAAQEWAPLLLGAAALGWGLRRTPRRRRRTASGQRPDSEPDIPVCTRGVTCADTCPDVPAYASPDAPDTARRARRHDHAATQPLCP